MNDLAVSVLAESAVREPPPAWVLIPLCVLVVLVGTFLVTDFRGIPSRLHERMGGSGQKGFSSSFGFQRVIGGLLIAGAAWSIVSTLASRW
ncbi:hypothetical protein [Streptomyces sp. NPDC001665]